FAFDFCADLAFDDFGAAAFDAEHGGHGWAVDVAVHEADFGAAAVETDGEVDGDGGFSDAALAGADGDDVLDLRERVAARSGGAAGVGGEVDLDVLCADFFQRGGDLALDGFF